MLLFKIGNPNGARVMFDASCHGNERVTSEVAYMYAEWLLKSPDPLAESILKRNYTLIVPIVNVDGFPDHRKLMNFEPPRTNGVDPNRNFDYRWGECESAITGGGCSLDPNSYVYRGPYPESEVENRNYRSLWARHLPHHYLNMHTGSPVQIWHSRTNDAKDLAYFREVYQKYVGYAGAQGVEVVTQLSPCGGTGCFDCTPYHYHHVYGWSCELISTIGINYSEIPYIFNKWLPFFIALSLESEWTPLPLPSWLLWTLTLGFVGAIGAGAYLLARSHVTW